MKARHLLQCSVLVIICLSLISVCSVVQGQGSERIPLKRPAENALEFKDWSIQVLDVLPAIGSEQFNYIVRMSFENQSSGQNTFVINPTEVLMLGSDGNKYAAISVAIVEEEWKSSSDGKLKTGRLQFLSHDIIVSDSGAVGFVYDTGNPKIFFKLSKKNNGPSWSITLSGKGTRELLVSFNLPINVQPKELYWPGPTIVKQILARRIAYNKRLKLDLLQRWHAVASRLAVALGDCKTITKLCGS